MILSFDKPQKIRSTEEHNKMYSSDSMVAGTFVSNMSEEDKKKFKAKHIKGEDERVEIRVIMNGVNLLIKVFKKSKKNRDRVNDHGEVQMSMNGKLDITLSQWTDINQAIKEATEQFNVNI